MFVLGVGTLMLVFGFGRLLPWWSRSDAVVVLLFALIIFGGARPTGNGTLLALPVFVLLGEASYSIYILHIPLHLWWDSLDFGLARWLNFVVYFAVVVAASVLSWHYIEMPLCRLIAGRRESRLPRPAGEMARRAGGGKPQSRFMTARRRNRRDLD